MKLDDTNIGMGNPMASVVNANVCIVLLDINFQEMITDAKNGSPW
jgi:hypothetical protein